MSDIMYPLLDNPMIYAMTESHIATPYSGDTRYFTVYDENDKAIEGGPTTRMASII